jgi:hypothetical protein
MNDMPRWVRCYWDEDDVTFFWEVGEDGGSPGPSSWSESNVAHERLQFWMK